MQTPTLTPRNTLPGTDPNPPTTTPATSRCSRRPHYSGASSRMLVRREVADALVSVAGLVRRPVRDQEGNEVGRVADVVVRWDAGYSPVTGLIVRVGARRAWVHAHDLAAIDHDEVRLLSTRFDLRDVIRRDGELQLVADVIDHQLVDVHGVRVVRASDLYLTQLAGSWRVVGVDVSIVSLLRRALPGARGRRPSPGQVLDWSGVQPFGVPGQPVRLQRPHEALRRLRPADLADLLEDLGRTERRELLDVLEPETAADALEEMDPQDLDDLLRDAPVEKAAALVASMEPDEAAEALRELPEEERDALLAAMSGGQGETLRALLAYDEETAGGVMTAGLVRMSPLSTVADAVGALRSRRAGAEEPTGIVVVDDDGRLVDDVSVFELLGADPLARLESLTGPPWPVTVSPDAELAEIVDRIVDNRRSSLLVVDAEQRPLGRILADDVIDALIADGDRRWPWQRRTGAGS